MISEDFKDIIVDVKNLDITFNKKKVVDNVSFKVKKGEIIGLFGISGAGKTTIIRVLTCQINSKNWSGDVKVTNLNPAIKKNHSKILSNIGYVPQLEELNLYYDLSPLKNIEVFASCYGMNKKEAKNIAKELFSILDIPQDTWKKSLKKMSGGEKKRASMAIGLIHQPDVLFLDEPTTGVDAAKRYEILSYLKKLNRSLGTTMFLITHDMEAALIVDQAAILRDGKLLEFDSNSNLISSLPSGGSVARFIIENLNEEKINTIKDFSTTANIKTIRVGNRVIEVLMDNFDINLPKLIEFMMENGIKIMSMSKDVAAFRRYFQLRIQEEEKKEKLLRKSDEEGEV